MDEPEEVASQFMADLLAGSIAEGEAAAVLAERIHALVAEIRSELEWQRLMDRDDRF